MSKRIKKIKKLEDQRLKRLLQKEAIRQQQINEFKSPF
jgi:hypothetical protein